MADIYEIGPQLGTNVNRPGHDGTGQPESYNRKAPLIVGAEATHKAADVPHLTMNDMLFATRISNEGADSVMPMTYEEPDEEPDDDDD